MRWKNTYRGFIMGTSELIPGVSGGTIALLLGIYDELIASINGLFSKDWAKQLRFLIPLGIGMGAALIVLSRVMDYLLIHYTEPTHFLFLGLIIGVLPFLFKEADASHTFKASQYVLLVIGIVLVASLEVLIEPSEGVAIKELTASTYILLFIGGVLASGAMILPGISGSMVFLILGLYPTVIGALKDFQFDRMVVIGLGVVFGIVAMSKIIHYFLKRHRTSTYALVIGFVIGSIVVVFPGFADETGLLLMSIVTFGIGLSIAFLLSKTELE